MLDTLAVATDLKSAGFSKAQAEGMAQTLNKMSGDLATKQDLDNTKRDLLRDLKLWIGGALVAAVTVIGALVALIVNLSKLTG